MQSSYEVYGTTLQRFTRSGLAGTHASQKGTSREPCGAKRRSNFTRSGPAGTHTHPEGTSREALHNTPFLAHQAATPIWQNHPKAVTYIHATAHAHAA